jgi:hypothetical protein
MKHKVRIDHEPVVQPPSDVGGMALICGVLYVLVATPDGKYLWWGLETCNHWARPTSSLDYVINQVQEAAVSFPAQRSCILTQGTRVLLHVGEG